MSDTENMPTAQLLTRLSEQTSALVRQELRLAQLELQEKGRHAGIGAGLLGAAGVVALFGAGTLVAMAVLLLTTALDHAWLAALIVGAVLLAVAGVMALAGKKQVTDATPPVPEQAMQSARTDVDAVKEAAHR
ncbi:MAG: hypothetical protein JWN65_1008 [Solirubrobacterales bacterium]|jgi:uncharacterized membrane protein YqjE|nr:hypothetical protein [Solirubrobacterales bacterium]